MKALRRWRVRPKGRATFAGCATIRAEARMKLEGSCQCGAVTFDVFSHHPYPFNYCYCSICRKTAGAGGFAININADYATMNVRGREHVTVYRARIQNPEDP